MHLVDRDRCAVCSGVRTPRHPVGIGPGKCGLVAHTRRRGRRRFGPARHRIALEAQLALSIQDLEFVERAMRHAGNEDLPHAGLASAHRMQAAIPLIEAADDADPLRIGRPHGKRCPSHVTQGVGPGAQHLPASPVVALGQQMQIERTQHRPKPIRIFTDLPVVRKRGRFDAQLIGLVRPKPWHWPSKHPGGEHRQPGQSLTAMIDDLDLAGLRLHTAHHLLARGPSMRPQHAEGISMDCAQQRIDRFGRDTTGLPGFAV